MDVITRGNTKAVRPLFFIAKQFHNIYIVTCEADYL